MAKPITECTVAAPMSDARGEILYRFLVDTLAGYERNAANGTVRRRVPGERGAVNYTKYDAAKEVPA